MGRFPEKRASKFLANFGARFLHSPIGPKIVPLEAFTIDGIMGILKIEIA